MTLTSHNVLSDVFDLENVVLQCGIMYSKNAIIDVLRDVFRKDRNFAFRTDIFGYPKTPSHLGLDPEAGLDDTETTRIFIGSGHRYDVKFNPSIIVRNTGSRYVPISFNQDLLNVIYTNERLVDGYGNETIIRSPQYHTLIGAWDQTIEVKIIAEDPVDREELTDIVTVALQSTRRLSLQNNGIFIRSISTGGEAESPYSNDNIYTTSVNLDVRSEFKVHIPISDVVERIGLCFTFDVVDTDEDADGLTITQQITTVDTL